ncbi:TVP38/TMEM64 family protein [Marinovum sp. 2_MG-2023]|uniref:TVP38/TMEM64 family protein n=1 Tax=Roseobacteraceae TaxID=2854170 RepID=UPI001FD1B57F|nr:MULTISPECIES: TVP38/TMEM64 family protein [Roseobacteraceae]MCJ7871675.1 TVP38/TMEM64 family protein [Phaeobacter sp. J2-8]MDO6728515.1 TVP38/TMEM64 family protein [Marinovum sp. 2_MG-2023]MDO6778069.1 TVP38/TMEM64 family protein [Marinovum sp. 1_MG-2023]
MTDMTSSHSSPKPGMARHLPLIAILLVAVIGFFTLRDYLTFDTLRDNRELLLGWRDSHFALVALAFVGIYVAIVAFSLPGAAVASVTGGFLFGLAAGSAFNVLAATIGATLIFLAARWGVGASLTAKLETSEGAVARIKDGLRDNEISVLLLLRLVPAVPFFVANLVPALVGVKFRNFVWTTAVGIIPGAIVFTSIGVGLGAVFDRGESPDLSLLWEPQILGPLLGLSVLAALPIIIKAVRGKKEI